MNQNRALRKTSIGLRMLAASLIYTACISQEGLRAQPDLPTSSGDSPAGSTPNVNSVSLIKEELSQEFQHLRRHQGQVLMARSGLHLIVAGVPLLNAPPSYYPLLAKIYRLAGKAWNTQSWLPIPEIAIRSASGELLSLIGQDLEASPTGTKVTSFFRSPTRPQLEARVSLAFVADAPALEINIQGSQSEPLQWDLRMSQGIGEEFAIPYSQEWVAGLSLALLPDVISLVSSVPLKQSNDGSYHHLETLQPAQASGFYLLLDRDALQQQARLVAQALDCYAKPDLLTASMNCLRTAWNPSDSWTIGLPARNPNREERRLQRPLYLHSLDGAFRSVLPLGEGEQLKIAQPAAEDLNLLYPDAEGALQHQKLSRLAPAVQLPALARGLLSLDVTPAQPSFVEIRDAVHADGVALQSWFQARGADLLSPHTLLQRQWPLVAQLPAGDYRIQVFTGAEILCQQRLTIRPNKRHSLHCQAEGPKPKLSPRASFSLDASRQPRELLQAASLQIAARSGKASPVPRAGLLAELSIIEASDPDLGLSLKAFPADDATRTAWQAFKGHTDPPRLQEFIAFVRKQAQPMQLVLECPAPGFQIEEYQWLALTFQPDTLEIFGCQQPEIAERLLAVAHRLQQKSQKAIKLSVASPFRSLYQLHAEIPAMYLFNRSSGDLKDQDLIDDLVHGLYSLGLRSEIEWPRKANSFALAISGKSVTLKIRSYDLKKAPGLLRSYDQNGLLGEQTIAASSLLEQELLVPLKLRAGSHWLRFELLSTEAPSSLSDESGSTPGAFLLATTNFLRLDDHR